MRKNPRTRNGRIAAPVTVRDRLMVQYARDGVLYATEDHIVWASEDGGRGWSEVCRLPGAGAARRIKDALLRSRPVRAIRRNIGIHNLVVLSSGALLIHYDGVYRCGGMGRAVEKVLRFSEEGIMGVLKNGLCVDPLTDEVYFGEYPIERPSAVRIFRGADDGRRWDVVHRFPPGEIRHVHTITPDPHRNRLWICTGDNDDEAALYYTDDRFKTLRVLGGGDHGWRMVSLIPTKTAIFWGSDAGADAPEDRENFIYTWDFRENARRAIQPIDKPAYYSTRLSDGTMVIGTHFEPPMKRKAAPSADAWISRDGGAHWELAMRFPHRPSGRAAGTRYASLCMPGGDHGAADLFFTPLNVASHDFSLMKWSPS